MHYRGMRCPKLQEKTLYADWEAEGAPFDVANPHASLDLGVHEFEVRKPGKPLFTEREEKLLKVVWQRRKSES